MCQKASASRGTSKLAAPRAIIHQSTSSNLLAPTSTVAHRTKRVAIELVGPTRWLLQQIQHCLVIRLHRATNVGNLSARIRRMTSSRLMIAHHVTASRPMVHRMGNLLLAMRNCPKWNSDKMTWTNLVTHVLKWVMSQVLTEKATTKRNQSMELACAQTFPSTLGMKVAFSHFSLGALGTGSVLSKLPLHVDDKTALGNLSALRRADPSSKPCPIDTKTRTSLFNDITTTSHLHFLPQ